jgi:hypothetical protein
MKKRLSIILTLMFIIILSGCVEVQPSDVTSVTVNFTPKVAYLAGEDVLLDEYEVKVFFETQDPMTFTLDDTDVTLVGGFYEDAGSIKLDTQDAGDQSLSISYGDVSVSVEYSVYDAIVTTTGYTLEGDIQERESTTPINSAITDVTDDTWIFVESGEYNEYVIAADDSNRSHAIYINNKAIYLRASKQVYLNPKDESGNPKPVFSIIRVRNSASVTIEGFILSDSWTNVGIYQWTNYKAPINLLNNHINAPETALNGNSIQFNGSGSTISGNTLYVATNPTVDYNGSGILVYNHPNALTNVIIANNTIIRDLDDDDNVGIFLPAFTGNNVSGITIHDNTISGGTMPAIQLGQDDVNFDLSDIIIRNNIFSQTVFGLGVYGNQSTLENFTMLDNQFINNRAEGHFALEVANGVLTENAIDVMRDAVLAGNDWGGQTPVKVEYEGYRSLFVPAP